MIHTLFGKILLTCDHPDGCKTYLRFKASDDAMAIIEENRWLAFSITPKGSPAISDADKSEGKLVFLCNRCQSKIPRMTQAQYLQMKGKVNTVK